MPQGFFFLPEGADLRNTGGNFLFAPDQIFIILGLTRLLLGNSPDVCHELVEQSVVGLELCLKLLKLGCLAGIKRFGQLQLLLLGRLVCPLCFKLLGKTAALVLGLIYKHLKLG